MKRPIRIKTKLTTDRWAASPSQRGPCGGVRSFVVSVGITQRQLSLDGRRALSAATLKCFFPLGLQSSWIRSSIVGVSTPQRISGGNQFCSFTFLPDRSRVGGNHAHLCPRFSYRGSSHCSGFWITIAVITMVAKAVFTMVAKAGITMVAKGVYVDTSRPKVDSL